jgi:hypothetical protein
MRVKMNKKHWTHCIVGILFLLVTTPATALPGPGLSAVNLGDKWDSVWRSLAGATNVQTFSAAEYQGYASGLLRTDLLAALNRAKAQHSLLNKADTRKIQFIVAGPEESLVVLAFSEGKLEAAFWRSVQLPGGADYHHPEQLSRIRGTLGQLRQACNAEPIGKKGRNHFIFQGNCGGAKLYLEYLPALDQVWALFHK